MNHYVIMITPFSFLSLCSTSTDSHTHTYETTPMHFNSIHWIWLDLCEIQSEILSVRYGNKNPFFLFIYTTTITTEKTQIHCVLHILTLWPRCLSRCSTLYPLYSTREYFNLHAFCADNLQWPYNSSNVLRQYACICPGTLVIACFVATMQPNTQCNVFKCTAREKDRSKRNILYINFFIFLPFWHIHDFHGETGSFSHHNDHRTSTCIQQNWIRRLKANLMQCNRIDSDVKCVRVIFFSLNSNKLLRKIENFRIFFFSCQFFSYVEHQTHFTLGRFFVRHRFWTGVIFCVLYWDLSLSVIE